MIWIYFVFASLPGSLAYYALTEIRLASDLLRNGVECQGIIVSQRTVKPARGAKYNIPKVRFTTVQGEIIEGESAVPDWVFNAYDLPVFTKTEFFDNDDACLRYAVNNPRQFLFFQQLDQTKNYWILMLASLMTIGIILSTCLN